MEKILVTGGAGFVGSSLCLSLRSQYPKAKIISFDNLRRRGSELALPRLKKAGVDFVHGDVRISQDVLDVGAIDLIIDCAAEPSVVSGLDGSTQYLIDTNLGGTISLLELAKKTKALFVLLSTSRIYPYKKLNELNFKETETRFHFTGKSELPGISTEGVSEDFPLDGVRTIYGSTKLSSELLLHEYAATFNFPYLINRCGVIAGPWQMGKVDQGFLVLWVAKHFFGGSLRYTGFGGKGKQVRDIIHVDDLARLIKLQINSANSLSGETFNVGGGVERLVSLREVTSLVQEVTKKRIDISSSPETHMNDCIYFCTDNRKITERTKWKPEKTVKDTIVDIHKWISKHESDLADVLR